MKTIVSILIALSAVAGITAPAKAFDPKSFWEQQERQSGGTANALDSRTLWEQAERTLP